MDVGQRRIGLAVSDPLGITAQGLPTLQRRNKRADLAEIERLVAEQHVSEIIVGHPLRLSGQASAQTAKVEEFAEDLRKRFKLPVRLWDERLTSAEANRLLRETDMSIRRRGEVVDQMSAVIILQSFMEARKAGNR
jgi:putative holliday junction resolvase